MKTVAKFLKEKYVVKLLVTTFAVLVLSTGCTDKRDESQSPKGTSVPSRSKADEPGIAVKSPNALPRLRKMLNLSPEQVAEISQIKQNGGGIDEIKATLTEAQLAIFLSKRDRKPGKSERTNFISRLESDLDLSASQVAEMRGIQERGGSRKELRAVLTKEQKSVLVAKREARKLAKGNLPDEP